MEPLRNETTTQMLFPTILSLRSCALPLNHLHRHTHTHTHTCTCGPMCVCVYVRSRCFLYFGAKRQWGTLGKICNFSLSLSFYPSLVVVVAYFRIHNADNFVVIQTHIQTRTCVYVHIKYTRSVLLLFYMILFYVMFRLV